MYVSEKYIWFFGTQVFSFGFKVCISNSYIREIMKDNWKLDKVYLPKDNSNYPIDLEDIGVTAHPGLSHPVLVFALILTSQGLEWSDYDTGTCVVIFQIEASNLW